MGEDFGFLWVAIEGFKRLDFAFTFILLLLRFVGMLMVIPGIGGMGRSLVVKYPAILTMTIASAVSTKPIPIPNDLAVMCAAMLSEILLGVCLGIVPQFIVACAQNAGQLASTAMGLTAGNVMDPTTGTQQTDLSRIYGDLVTVAFLLLGGHHVVISAVSGLGGKVPPGSFVLGQGTIDLFISYSSEIFRMGMMLASPVLVALLLTQFVMGLVSKAVPTVNIFIVSFPLTIGIGLILTMIALPDMMRAVGRQFNDLDRSMEVVISETQ